MNIIFIKMEIFMDNKRGSTTNSVRISDQSSFRWASCATCKTEGVNVLGFDGYVGVSNFQLFALIHQLPKINDLQSLFF